MKGLETVDFGGMDGNVTNGGEVVWAWSEGGIEKWLDMVVPEWDEEVGDGFPF